MTKNRIGRQDCQEENGLVFVGPVSSEQIALRYYFYWINHAREPASLACQKGEQHGIELGPLILLSESKYDASNPTRNKAPK